MRLARGTLDTINKFGALAQATNMLMMEIIVTIDLSGLDGDQSSGGALEAGPS